MSVMSLDDTVIVRNDVAAVEENSECDGKKRKLNNDGGNLSCQYANCEYVDDENTFRCSQCKAKFHSVVRTYHHTRLNVSPYKGTENKRARVV